MSNLDEIHQSMKEAGWDIPDQAPAEIPPEATAPAVEPTLSPNPTPQPIVSPLPNSPESVDMGGWEGFKQKAEKISAEKGYPANVLIGQAALETGRGTSSFAKNRNNYFGYQAYDSNPDAAKKYMTQEDSINDYIRLITQSPIYAKAWGQYQQDGDSGRLLENIRNSGYASDSNYIQKIKALPEFNTQPKTPTVDQAAQPVQQTTFPTDQDAVKNSMRAAGWNI